MNHTQSFELRPKGSAYQRSAWAAFFCVVGISPVPCEASFHLMQIEQIIGGVNGDARAQAIQLRMRSSGQNLVAPARMRVYDALGNNPILIVDFASSVPDGAEGARILITGPTFSSHTSPAAVSDFAMVNLIPPSYFAAGSLTFETDDGAEIYWRLSWGGYTGPGDGVSVDGNDADGQFNPPFPQSLPRYCTSAIQFIGPATMMSTDNSSDYLETAAAATFHNNAGTAFAVSPCLVNSDCNDGLACSFDSCNGDCCLFNPNHAACDDGEFCTGPELCTSSGCMSEGNPCGFMSICDEDADQCRQDCNLNGVDDTCDLSCAGACSGVPFCGQSNDCQPNGVPDECEPDCDSDGFPDSCIVGVCALGGGACCTPHAGLGCGDPCCCESVCANQPFCCSVQWDGPCADEARMNCSVCPGPPCDISCEAFATLENEPNCGRPTDVLNGGCDANPPVFAAITCGDTYCGTIASDGQTRDMDWYEVTVDEDTQLTWIVVPAFDAEIGIVIGPTCPGTAVMNYGICDVTISQCVPPGTHWVYVTPQIGNYESCGTIYNATLECVPAACAQVPMNDTCDTAEAIAVGGAAGGGTQLASFDPAPFCDVSASAPGVWYRVLGNGNTLTASVCDPGTTFDTTLQVFCGNCSDLACVGGNDDFCGNPPGHSQFSWCSAPGVDYFILVAGFESNGDFVLTVDDGPSCSNPPSCATFPCSTLVDCRFDPANNACNQMTCPSSACTYSCIRYGDVKSPQNGIVDLDDILCLLAGFGNFSNCPDADLAPCGGDGINNLDDILAVLSAFSGNDPCGCQQAGNAPLCGSISP